MLDKRGRKEAGRGKFSYVFSDSMCHTVGGATSICAAHRHGFELFHAIEPDVPGRPMARSDFNGLDMDKEVGQVGQYVVAITGMT